jgi:hypothetical protein
MGTASDVDDRDHETDEKDETTAEEEAETKSAAAGTEHEDDSDDEGDEADDEAEAAASDEPVAKKAPEPAKRPSAAKRSAPPPRGGASLTKNMVLFVAIIGALAVGFAYLGRETAPGAPPPAPKWATGQSVDVEITVVPNDVKELACASADEIGGKHCQFEGQNKPWTKSPSTDDKQILKPYTTTDRMQFVAAGLWSEDALSASKMPKTRFSVKCKYKVEGKIKAPAVRWASDGPWYAQQNEWYAGSVSGCKLVE